MGRGPSYPYVGLESAIGLARKIYDYTKRGAAPVESVVTDALGYSATSSSGQKVLAALKAFGLVEDAPGTNGKSIKLSQRSIRILLDEPDSNERREEIKSAALSPRWYEHCWKKWGSDMPPAMRSSLLIEHGFVDSTVEGFLKDYRATIAFAGLTGEGSKPKTDKSEEESASPENGNGIQSNLQGSEEGAKLLNAPAISPLASPSGGITMRTDTLTLADGITLQLQWPSVISQETYEDFEYQLEGFKKRLRRAVQSQQSSIELDREG